MGYGFVEWLKYVAGFFELEYFVGQKSDQQTILTHYYILTH